MYEIVRPFERPNALATSRIVATNKKIPAAAATISWGKAGTLPGAQEIEAIDPAGLSFTVLTCDDEYEEIPGTRRNVTKRITQIDDNGNPVPENYIDLARPTELYFWKQGDKAPNYNKTTTWQTNVDTASFSTMNDNNKKCRSNYKLDITTAA